MQRAGSFFARTVLSLILQACSGELMKNTAERGGMRSLANVFPRLLNGLAPSLGLVLCLVFSPAQAEEKSAAPPTAFKVCADPNNLPFSNKAQQGFENKMAELFAKELKQTLAYTWFPQRIGFIRNTLQSNETEDGSFKCDIVMGVVEDFELAATTKPYYRSAWQMVYVKGRGLDDVKSADDLAKLSQERKNKLKIGVFHESTAVNWLMRHNMLEQIVPYQTMSGDVNAYPGQIIEKDLSEGKLDVTFVWGPIAGYFAKQAKDKEFVLVALKSEPGIPFEFNISMGVRHADKARKEQLNQLIEKHKSEIHAILTEYGVPLAQ
jgi:quinoprotein dehydrogenase-associated probable ABC transporter substrate-binding protein